MRRSAPADTGADLEFAAIQPGNIDIAITIELQVSTVKHQRLTAVSSKTQVTMAVTALRQGVQQLQLAVKNTRMRLTHGHYIVAGWADRKSTRLNSSHVKISYAVF